MNPGQKRAFKKLLMGTPADFLKITLAEVKALPDDIGPIFLMYAKATGKGPSSFADPAAHKHLLLYDKDLSALKQVRRAEVCCAVVYM